MRDSELAIDAARATAVMCGFSLTDDQLEWLLWNRTAFPICDGAYALGQLIEHLNGVRTNGPFPCVRCGGDNDVDGELCQPCHASDTP